MKIDTATIFVEVYGTFRAHPWVEPERLDDDAYSMFVSRAVSMGGRRRARTASARCYGA